MAQSRRLTLSAGLAMAGALALSASVLADGTETLGPPSITIASGSGIAVGGIGLEDSQPANLDVAVPAGAVVNQVLLYWEGHSSTADGGDSTIEVDGTEVAGTKIGGGTLFFGTRNYSTTFRADVTSLDAVAPGANSLSIGGLSFDRNNNGAGILVIFDDGSNSVISIVDGNDLAFVHFAPPLDATVAQTFAVDPEPIDRTGEIEMFFSSVAGPDHAGLRPSTIEVTSGGVTAEFVNILGSVDGNEWDTVVLPVTIPAGATEVKVQAFSDDRLGTGLLPASFAWNAAGLTVPTTPPPPGGGQGCTPGYWKQPHHLDSWVGYSPGDNYEAVFGVDTSFKAETLLEAAGQGGGGEKALGRHAVAALLNASSGDVDYMYTVADVIASVQDAYATGDFKGVKNQLEYQNELGCPLN